MNDEQARRARVRSLLAQSKLRLASKFNRYFPDCLPTCKRDSLRVEDHPMPDGSRPICRVLYVKHLMFMAAGALLEFRERMFLAANRIGKTEAAAFEVTCHLTGLYPHWWQGRRFPGPIRMWAAGDTMLTTRDILQVALFGPADNVDTGEWSGMIPAHLVLHHTRRSGAVAKCLEQVSVRHASGGRSVLEFKSFDQGRRIFQGTEQELIWLDEEPPEDVVTECLTRTATTEGALIYTFTPLQGLTPFLQQYLETSKMLAGDGALKPANSVFFPEAA